MAMSDAKRVVVTGVGWVTPLGRDVDSVWTKLLSGASAVGPVTHFDAGTFATNFAAQVEPFELAHFIADHANHADAHPHVRYALAAAAQAWKQSGLGDVSRPGQRNAGHPQLDGSRLGIYLGSGEGTLDFDRYTKVNVGALAEDGRTLDYAKWGELSRGSLTRAGEVEQEPNMALAHLADCFGASGPAFNCMTACAASTQSVGEAYWMLRRGDVDVMLAGGSHTMIHPLGMTGFIRLTAMSTRTDDPAHASRPFDKSRDGFVMGEGAGVLVLESLDHALARGATPLCEVVGYGSSADAYRITDIEPDGMGAVKAMRRALEMAGIDPTAQDDSGRPSVQYISAHGTGTQENDAIETKAVKTTFGEQAPRVCFSSVKSMMGHLIQAAGAVELITCVQAIRTGMVPPTINLHTPDPDCDLDYVPNEARDLSASGGIDVAMSNGFGFGGQNNSMIVRRYAG
ncbi:MAG: beta-ketoacyl-[acyl-carrier-protein] synthase family protein [Phycisphaerales bacterium]